MDENKEANLGIGDTTLPLALGRRQSDVFELLKSLSTDRAKLHEWYEGAIQILNSRSSDKVAQAAHSIRELCDRIPKIISNIPEFKNPVSTLKQFGPQFLNIRQVSYKSGWSGETISEPLGKILCNFENICKEPPRTKRFGRALTATDPQADFMSKDWRKERDKEFEDLVSFFQNVAHHNSTPAEEKFLKQLELFETLLLNYLTPCTAAQQKELIELMQSPPSVGTLARVSDLISHKTANYTFFFEKLTNSQWLPLLDQESFFDNLPEAEKTENGQIVYRHHPPLLSLTHLADAFPQEVTSILIKLKLPNNSTIGDQVLQCMAKIRSCDCIRQLGPLINQLGENPTRTGWLWIVELLSSWIELDVHPKIFSILDGYMNCAVELSFSEYSGDSNAWLTSQVDEKFLGRLTVQSPMDVAKLTFQALCKWAAQERSRYSATELTEDAPFSYWQEDFKSPPALHRGVEGILALRLYLAAEQIFKNGNSDDINELDHLLRSNSCQLFRRVRWQLYADFPSVTLEFARSEVLQRIPYLNEIDYGRGCHDYEFAQLLHAHVKQYGDAFLSPKEVEQFVAAVLQGPVDRNGTIIEDFKDAFCRKQLWPIEPLLRGEQALNFIALVQDGSKINLQSYRPFVSGGVVGGAVESVAPPEADNLESMSDKDLWEFLNTWEPK